MSNSPSTAEVIAIEYEAKPKKTACPDCLGFSGVGDLPHCTTCRGMQIPQAPPFEREKVVPIGNPERCPVFISVDGVPYAGYNTLAEANEAAKAWTGYIDGLGRPVSEYRGVHWPGCWGRSVRVVNRQGLRG